MQEAKRINKNKTFLRQNIYLKINKKKYFSEKACKKDKSSIKRNFIFKVLLLFMFSLFLIKTFTLFIKATKIKKKFEKLCKIFKFKVHLC